MSSLRNPSEPPIASSVNEETPDFKSPAPAANRNSWIYNPVSLPSSNTKAKETNGHPNLLRHAEVQIDAALDLLADLDFVDSVQILREKNQLSCEEAMRQLYNSFYAKEERSSNSRTTWSQHRQQRPPIAASTSSPEGPSNEQPPQLRGRSPDTVWDRFKAANAIKDVSLSTYSQYETAQPQTTSKSQHRPSQPSMPTFPTQPLESYPRSIRGATFSNARKTDGTALDERFASRLNLYGGGPVGDGNQFRYDDPVERLPYNPTASTFTPTGPRHALSRTMNNNFIGNGYMPDTANRLLGAYGSSNQAVGRLPECFGKGSENSPKSPRTEDVNEHDDSGLGLTPPKVQHEAVSRAPVPAKLNQGGTDERRFIPMNAAMKEGSVPAQVPPLYFNPVHHTSPITKFSERYLGQHTENNASANIPEDYNCAVWIRNLPPNVTYTELLGSIQGIGRIWCSYINVPDYIKHHTAAAKVVFYRPESARTLLEFVFEHSPNIRGHYFKADLNRIKSAPHSLGDGTSRVLIITGQDWFADKDYLNEWFAQQCQFQLDQAVTHIKLHGHAVIEFRFGSYRSQAEAGFKALTINRPKGFDKVEFGDDPCEVGETLTSRSIALQRFQGIGV